MRINESTLIICLAGKIRGHGEPQRRLSLERSRRKLPFERADLLLAMDWCAASARLSGYSFPVGNLARALQRFAETNELDAEFEGAKKHQSFCWPTPIRL